MCATEVWLHEDLIVTVKVDHPLWRLSAEVGDVPNVRDDLAPALNPVPLATFVVADAVLRERLHLSPSSYYLPSGAITPLATSGPKHRHGRVGFWRSE